MNVLSHMPRFLTLSQTATRPTGLMPRVLTLFLSISAILLFAGTSPAAPRQTPEAVVATVQRAIDTSDLPLFEQHVDVNALLEQGASALLTRLQSTTQRNTSSLPPVLALMMASAQNPDMAKQIKALLIQEVGTFARYGVSSGLFAGKRNAEVPPQGLLAPLLNDASTGRKVLKVTGKAVRDASGVTLPTTIHDYGNDRDYRVVLRLEPASDSWQIKQIANMNDLLSRIQKEAAER